MSIKPEHEIISEEDINVYECWKVLVKRKKILIGIFLIPVIMATIISVSLPRFFRGESEIVIAALPAPHVSSVITAPNIVKLTANTGNKLKEKIFFNNPDAIKSVSVSIPKIAKDRVEIIINAKTAEIMPQAFQNVLYYIGNIPAIKEEIARIQADNVLRTEMLKEEADFKIKKLIEAKKANLLYFNYITEIMKNKQLSYAAINPSDLIVKDTHLSLEIASLQQAKRSMVTKELLPIINNVDPANSTKKNDALLEKMSSQSIKVTVGTLGPISITKQPSDSKVKQIIIITGLISLVSGIFMVFLLDYIDRIKERENKFIATK